MEKITAILATGMAPFQCFFRSIVSLLIHTDPEVFDQIIVSINGPDNRTGEPVYQDKKQQFCEALADMGYPVTVVRAWSRVGFGQPYDMATALIKTDVCLYMHDDIVVLKDWMAEAFPKFMADPEVAVMCDKPLVANKILANLLDAGTGILRLDMPFINNSFLLIRQSRIAHRWQGHYMNLPSLDLEEMTDMNVFREFWKKEGNYSILPGPDAMAKVEKLSRMATERSWKTYQLMTTNMGSWIYYDLYTKGARTASFSLGTVEHYEGMSWSGEAMNEVDLPTPILHEFREKVRKSPFEELCRQYMPELAPMPNISAVKPLVGVVVYNRIDCIDAWLKAWNNADKYGAKVAVFHTYDGDQPDPAETANILKHNPDFYIPVPNISGDLWAFAKLCEGEIKVDCDWNALCWFTDDIIPLRRDFIYPMLFELVKPGVGMTGGWYNDQNIRTVNFGIQREVMEKLSFKTIYDYILSHKPGIAFRVGVPIDSITDEFCFRKLRVSFVSRVEGDLAQMVRDAGYATVPMTFRYSAKYAWDCDHEGIVNLWHKYEAQFDD